MLGSSIIRHELSSADVLTRVAARPASGGQATPRVEKGRKGRLVVRWSTPENELALRISVRIFLQKRDNAKKRASRSKLVRMLRGRRREVKKGWMGEDGS